ncbi:MAG TPA: TonB-dependent receptor [Terriglobales bacterium]|nr:TonB-dependent receptor [Terriglobales bacterium]
MKSLSPKDAGSVVVAMRGPGLRHLLALFVLLGPLATHVFAQEATIVGTITDPTGAAVPNVAITITNNQTGQTRQLTSNSEGQYVAPSLPIGHYTLRAQAPGFKVVEQKDVVLAVAARVRVDFKLEVGAAHEEITVETAAVAVQTDSGDVSQVVTSQQLSQLATNGRSIYTLVNLTPGAASLQGDFQTPTPVGGDANVSFNGNRPVHNIYLMDGGEDLDRGGGGTFSVMPSLESLAEFRTMTSNYSAEYGLSSAATMTTVLKSGTNSFHASAWYFGRNDALDARNYFNPAPQPVAELRFHVFGFNAGGPVDFWKQDHKTFFFYNMEWRRLIQGQTLNQKVPLTSTYQGDFAGTGITPHTPCASQLAASLQAQFAAAGQTLSTCDASGNVITAQPFTGNQIPASLLDANAQSLLTEGKIFPAPTNGAQFQGGNNSPTYVTEEIARVDHTFNDKFSIFGHWVSEQISQTFGTTMWSGDNVPTIGNTFGNPSYSAVVHATHTISPTLLNEIAFNYNGNRINIIPQGKFGAPLSAPSSFTFNRVFTGPNASDRMPTINLSQATGAQYSANWTPWVNKADDYQIRDDLSWTKGAHQLKFGFSWALYKKVQDLFASTQGNFGFNGFYTGNDFADFLLGYAQSYSEDGVHDHGDWNNVSYAAYVQDNWRTSRRLTLNLGLRWDGVPHTYEANHRMSNFYPNLYQPDPNVFLPNGTINPANPHLGPSPNSILQGYQFYLNGIGVDGLNGIPKGLVDNHWAAFGPRLGFAYDVTGEGKTVVRGGFGVMYERIQGNDMYNGGTNIPFSASVTFNNVLLANPKVAVSSGTQQPVAIPVASITGISQKQYNLPVSYQYSLGVQRALGARSVFSLSYVGNQNRFQNDWREIDLPPASDLAALVQNSSTYNQSVLYPGFHNIRLAINEANANYNSLQADLRGNLTRDLSLQFGYTYSRAIDPTTGNGGNGYDLNNVSNPYVGWRYDYGPSVFNRTHVGFVNFVYNIPFLNDSPNRVLKAAFGGWQVSGIVTAETGAPLDVRLAGTSVSSIIPNSTNRPDLVGNISYLKQRVPQGIQWFDPSAFGTPASGTWGDLGHNAVAGPGRDNWNLSVFKNFAFTERARLEFRADSFNAWNHTQWKADVQNNGYGNSLNGGNFGIITQAYDPRVFQLGLKLIF